MGEFVRLEGHVLTFWEAWNCFEWYNWQKYVNSGLQEDEKRDGGVEWVNMN